MMPRPTQLARLSLPLALLCLSSLAGATTLLEMDVEALVAHSDAVAVVRVVSVDTVQSRGRITRHVQLEVEEGLLGAKPGSSLVALVPGGETTEWIQHVPGAPEPKAGERALVFLEGSGGGFYRFTGLAQGWLPITHDPDDPDILRVKRSIEARLLQRDPQGGLSPAEPPPATEPLAPLLDRVRRAVELR